MRPRISIRGFVRLLVRPSIRLSVRPSVRPSVRLSIRPSVRPSVSQYNSRNFKNIHDFSRLLDGCRPCLWSYWLAKIMPRKSITSLCAYFSVWLPVCPSFLAVWYPAHLTSQTLLLQFITLFSLTSKRFMRLGCP